MTIKSKLATLFAAGMLASTVAAHAQGAMAPDPNIAPSTSGVEAEIPGTTANSPSSRLPRTRTWVHPPAAWRRSSQARPRTAPSSRLPRTRTWVRPPPDEEAEIQSGVLGARASAASDTPEAIQQ